MDKFDKALPEEKRAQYRQEKEARNLRTAKSIALASATLAVVATITKTFSGNAYFLTLVQIITVSLALAGLISILIPVMTARITQLSERQQNYLRNRLGRALLISGGFLLFLTLCLALALVFR
jgi:hypothetical protein